MARNMEKDLELLAKSTSLIEQIQKKLDSSNTKAEQFANKFVRKAGYRFWASVALKQYMFMNLLNMATTAWFGEKDEEEQSWPTGLGKEENAKEKN